ESAPAVDDQEDVTEGVISELAACARRAEAGHAVDLVFREQLLALVEHSKDLGDRPPHCAGVLPTRDAADVRQSPHHAERAAAEVDGVHLYFARCVTECEAGHQGSQCGALPAVRTTEHQHMAAGAGEIEDLWVASLLERPVDDAGHRAQL